MSSNFKPLTPGANASGAAPSGKATGQRDLKSQFHPIGVSGDNVRPAMSVGAHVAPASHGPHGSAVSSTHTVPMEPTSRVSAAITRLIRDGERITHIEVQCGCGEIITLECGYTVAAE